MTARSCNSNTAKLERPTVAFRRPWLDNSSSTIAVEDSDRLEPRIMASEGPLPA